MKKISMLALVLGLTLSSCAHSSKKSCCGSKQCKMSKEQCKLKGKDGEKKECCKKGEHKHKEMKKEAKK